jgi:hypothetical protein
MISDGRSDPNRKVLVESVGKNLLPTAQAWILWQPCLTVATPGTRASHTYLFCDRDVDGVLERRGIFHLRDAQASAY